MAKKKTINLQRAYSRFNRLYFDNDLPKDAVIQWANLEGLDRWAQCIFCGKSARRFDRVYIEISEELRYCSRTALFSLLHEMSHLQPPCVVTHGKEFDRRMLSLAKRGAFTGIW